MQRDLLPPAAACRRCDHLVIITHSQIFSNIGRTLQLDVSFQIRACCFRSAQFCFHEIFTWTGLSSSGKTQRDWTTLGPSSLMTFPFIYLLCGLSLHCLKRYIEWAPHPRDKGQIWIGHYQSFTLLQVVTQTSFYLPLNHTDVQPLTDSYITGRPVAMWPLRFTSWCVRVPSRPLSNHTVYTAASSASPWLSWKAAELHQWLTLLLINQNFTTQTLWIYVEITVKVHFYI